MLKLELQKNLVFCHHQHLSLDGIAQNYTILLYLGVSKSTLHFTIEQELRELAEETSWNLCSSLHTWSANVLCSFCEPHSQRNLNPGPLLRPDTAIHHFLLTEV